MDYVLVLQFEGDDEETVESVIALEDHLIEAFDKSTSTDVDGHETGDGVTHLMLTTKNPAKVWEKIEPVIETAATEGLEILAVAYRSTDGEDYTVLWPSDYEGEFEMT